MSNSTLEERIRSDLNAARRERDRLRTVVLSTFISELRNLEIETQKKVSDEQVTQLLGTAIKRRREAAEQMRAGGREELAEKEDQEAGILQSYLPPQLDEAEVRELVRGAISSGASDIGGVMKSVMPEVKGRFEGRELNRIVREELEAAGGA